MKKIRPPYLLITARGEFYSFGDEPVIPVVRAIFYWARRYFGQLPLMKFSRIFFTLLWMSLSHSVHDSPTGST